MKIQALSWPPLDAGVRNSPQVSWKAKGMSKISRKGLSDLSFIRARTLLKLALKEAANRFIANDRPRAGAPEFNPAPQRQMVWPLRPLDCLSRCSSRGSAAPIEPRHATHRQHNPLSQEHRPCRLVPFLWPPLGQGAPLATRLTTYMTPFITSRTLTQSRSVATDGAGDDNDDRDGRSTRR